MELLKANPANNATAATSTYNQFSAPLDRSRCGCDTGGELWTCTDYNGTITWEKTRIIESKLYIHSFERER